MQGKGLMPTAVRGVAFTLALVAGCYEGLDVEDVANGGEHLHQLRRLENDAGIKSVALMEVDGSTVAVATVHDTPYKREMVVSMAGEDVTSTFDKTSLSARLHVLRADGEFEWPLGTPPAGLPAEETQRYESMVHHWNNQYLDPHFEGWINGSEPEEEIEFRTSTCRYPGGTNDECTTACMVDHFYPCLSACSSVTQPASVTLSCKVGCLAFKYQCEGDFCSTCAQELPPPPPPPPDCWPCGCIYGIDAGCDVPDSDDDDCANGCCYGDGC